MADGGVLDLYAEDLEKDFSLQGRDEFGGDGVDLYDDIGPADGSAGGPTSGDIAGGDANAGAGGAAAESVPGNGSNGVYHQSSGAVVVNNLGRRYQLYVGNLTWWTTDSDIANVMREIGVNDFQEVKFFENRANGQSKGFCVVSMGSENSSRLVLERLSKKELHGQIPMVTYPTKQALNQFESMQKTRPVPPPQQNGPPRGPAPNNMISGSGPMPGHSPGQVMPPGHPGQRMMNPNMPQGQYRPPHMGQGPPVGATGVVPARMQSAMHQGGPMGGQPPLQGPPRYPINQGQWGAGQPRPNGPRPGPPGPQQRPPMFQGPPGGMPMRGPRPDWNRPPMHAGGFPPQGGPPGGPPQGPPMMQGPPRGGPPQIGGPGGPPGAGGPNPHVNPAFFNQGGVPPQHPGVPQMGGPHGPPGPGPQQGMNMPPQHGPPPHFAQAGPRGPWPPGPQQVKPPGPFPDPAAMGPQLSEAEFEEVMSRNRTVSSSAIARAVSDAATGEYSSAIETLVTAISLIKQSKVAHDERCKILISSLQDTLHGIEAKSYNRRERSRSRERTHRARPRRERSSSRYRERSRERERDHRDREGGSYRERSRSRERAAPDHYRDDSSSRSGRPRKSPEQVVEPVSEAPSKRSYYEERSTSRYRERSRERDRDRDRREERREEHRSRH